MTSAARAIALYAEARTHKRLGSYHRQQARLRMDELRRFCETAGIDIALVVATGGQGHDGRNGNPQHAQPR